MSDTIYRLVEVDHIHPSGKHDATLLVIHKPGNEITTIRYRTAFDDNRAVTMQINREQRRVLVEALLEAMELDGELG